VNELSIENFEKSMRRAHGKIIFPNTSWESSKNFISQNSFDLKLGKVDKDSIEEAAKWAVEYYDLLMLTERFDESLILLKDMWKLDFEDIVSLKAKDNSAAQIFRVEDLSKNFTDFILEKNHLDVVLYKIASNALDEKIKIFGIEKMAREIELLKQERKKFEGFCTQKEEKTECQLLKTQGALLTKYVKKRKDDMKKIK